VVDFEFERVGAGQSERLDHVFISTYREQTHRIDKAGYGSEIWLRSMVSLVSEPSTRTGLTPHCASHNRNTVKLISAEMCKVCTHCRPGIGHLQPHDASQAARVHIVFVLPSPLSSLPFSTLVVKRSQISLKQSSSLIHCTAKPTTKELLDCPYQVGQCQDPESPLPHAVCTLHCPHQPSRSPQFGRNVGSI